MSGRDDVSTPAPDVAQPANSWDAVSSPINTAVPDNSGLVKNVQDNLAPKPAAEGAESTEQPAQQTAGQKLDAGMGMPVSSILRSGDSPKNDQHPLPADIRGHLVDAYAKGAATNAGDYMQSALPTVANAIERTGRAALQGTGMILGFVPDSLVRLAYTGAQAAGLIDKNKSVDDLPSVQKGFAELDVLPKNLAQNSIQEKADQMASMVPALAVGGGATLPTAAWRTLYMGVAGLFGPKASEAIGNWATEHFPDQPFIHESLSQMANFGTMLGIGGVGYKAEAMLPGHTALAPVVGDAIGKEAKDVTPQDINQTIAKGFENVAPKAQDFHDVAEVLPITTPETLRQVYKETGVHPDQVFEDVKTNPDAAKELAEGKVPTMYEHLKEPPITASAEEGGGKEPPNEPPKGSAYNPEHPFEEGQPNTPQRSEEGASTSINPLAKILNPAGISESSKDMATAIRQGRGPADQVTSQIADQVKEHAATFNKMSEEDRLNFIQYVETKGKGATIPPELKAIADQLAAIYDRMHSEVTKAAIPIGYVENYHPHVYENEAGYQKFFNDWTAKQGGPRNLKERTFPTLQEAMEAGFKPKTTNPVEALMSYVGNMNSLIAASRSVDLAIKGGIADYFVKGEQPEGWVPLNGNLAERNGKTLFAPEDAARVYNNDISEKATNPIGGIADVVQRANNFASKLVLGLSGYHFTATTMASMASDVARATGSGLVSAVVPFADTMRGSKFINAYLGREELPPELQKALDLAVKNNTVNVRQPDYLKAGPPKDYVDAFKSGTLGQEIKAAGQTIKENPLIGPIKVLSNEIGRTMDTISKPLFDHYIPRIKISANISELHDWLQAHPEASEQEMDRKAQEIGNSIDNRFGEMMRDNLFWHQLTRQTLQTALLSYSWVAGGARMLKGIPDTMQTALGKVGIGEGQELSSNAKYLFGMAATYAVVNGVRTYLGTGKAPDDWKDFIYPRTGGTTPQGKEEREILPSHIGQFTNYLHDAIGELGNEVSPGLKLMYHLLANTDFRGLPITNENNSWFDEQRWGDYAKYVLHEVTPIGLKNFLQGPKKGSEISPAEQALGVRQAPRFITDPEGYKAMIENVNNAEYKKKQRSDQNAAGQYQNSEE